MPLNLNIPQFEFYSMNKPFRAFVGGYRSGKTFLGCVRLLTLSLEYPGIKLGYFAPTYPQIRDIFYSTVSDVAELMGMEVEIKTSTNEVIVSYHGDIHSIIKCRSMEHPQRIVGFDINHALIDEIDCMKKDKADAAWKKIVARLSSSGFDEARLYDEEASCELVIEALGENTVDFTTTPEGFNWVYDFFVKQLKDDIRLQEYYGIVHASTRKNAKNLPPDYIDKLYATYPANLVDAYVDGKFVNLTGGTVYRVFDRHKNHSDAIEQAGETLHIGLDFNVQKMSAIVHVERDGDPIAVNEIFGMLDTPDMIAEIKRLYPNYYIRIYPDSSGKNRKSNEASTTDISQLEDAGFAVCYDSVNPRVRDRINAMNAMFCNGEGVRRYKVNTNRCPRYTDDLEQQVYNKQGEPDKAHDTDHTCFTGDTLVMTDKGPTRIDHMQESGTVYGADGKPRSYTNCELTGSNKVTVSVVFSDGSTVKCTPDHKFLVEGGSWVQAKDLQGMKCLSLAKRYRSSTVKDSTFAGITIPSKETLKAARGCIESCGNSTMETLRRVFTFTTSIMTGLTTTSTTCSSSLQANTLSITTPIKSQESDAGRLAGSTSTQRKNGTLQQRGESGIGRTIRSLSTSFTKRLCSHAANVAKSLKVSLGVVTISAQRSVKQRTDEHLALMTSRENVSNAAQYLQQTSTLRTLDVVSVDISNQSDVYCLTVSDHGCFALAGGQIVSNCDAGGYYIAYNYPIVKPTTTIGYRWNS